MSHLSSSHICQSIQRTSAGGTQLPRPRACMSSLRNFEDGKGAPLGVLWLCGPAASVRVPGESQGMPAGDKVLWPKYVSAMPDCERSSFTRDCSDSKYVNVPGNSTGVGTELTY